MTVRCTLHVGLHGTRSESPTGLLNV